jgi:hypothetical protein
VDIQAKIRDALADLDDLLVHGYSIGDALRIASSENGVSEHVLQSRASREMSLEERRNLVIDEVERSRQSPLQASTEKADSRCKGYWKRSRSGKKVWVDPLQLKFDF